MGFHGRQSRIETMGPSEPVMRTQLSNEDLAQFGKDDVIEFRHHRVSSASEPGSWGR
jgi:hypothetical protein